jgi:L-malate glycosyltransferase
MKIAHVVDSMEIGGAETLVYQLCRLQRDQGHQPEVYAIAALGSLGERMLAEGFAVTANVGRHLTDSFRAFLHIFKKTTPDVVHLHNPTPTIYAAVPARIAGAQSIISTRHSLVAPPHNRLAELKYAAAATSCDWIVGICEATVSNLKTLRTIPNRKLVRVYNGTTPLPRHSESLSKEGFTFLFVGRMEPVKNLRLLLRAFKSALSQDPELRLWLVGDGSQRRELEELAVSQQLGASIRFWGQQLDVAPFFDAADTFIMSSDSEGLPMSLLQAFSLGIPAIVTEVGGMAEVVRLGGSGLTVPPGDPEALCRAILNMATNPLQRQEFSVNAAETYHQYFTLATTATAYMDLYRNRFQR